MQKRIIDTLLALMVLHAGLYTFHGYELFGVYLLPATVRAVFLAIALLSTFWLYRARKGSTSGRIPWYDFALMLIAVVPGVYVVFSAKRVMEAGGGIQLFEVILAVALILVILEAARRTAGGWLLVIVGAFFVLYPMFNNYLPGFLFGRGYPVSRIAADLYLSIRGIFGVPIGVMTTIVVVFLLFGQLFYLMGAGKFFTDIAFALLGHMRGGPAKVAVVASALFGTISGSSAANVLTTGIITIPIMKKVGYSSNFAGAVEAVASTGGNIMPPVMGVVAFMIPDFINVTYAQVAVAAAIPAVIYYFGLYAQVHLEAMAAGIAGLDRSRLPSLGKTLKQGWLLTVPLIVLVFFLMVLQYSPETAALYSIGAMIVVSMFNKETRLGPRKIMQALTATGRIIVAVGPIAAIAGIIIGSMNLGGMSINLASELDLLAGQNLPLLVLMAAIACIILGTGLNSIAVYILVTALIAPSLIRAGVLPLAAHLFVFYFAIASTLTPPVCMTVFTVCTISGGDFWRTAFQACRLGIAAFVVPFAFVWDYSILMMGQSMDIIRSAILTAIGIVALAIAFEGYLLRRISILGRIIFAAAGLPMILFTRDIRIEAGLLVLLVAAVFWYWWRSRRVEALDKA